MDKWTMRIMLAGACGFLLLVIAGLIICTVTIRDVRQFSLQLEGLRYKTDQLDLREQGNSRDVERLLMEEMLIKQRLREIR